MRKISNEFKVGIVALVTILTFIWLYSFLKGKDIFSNKSHYYSVYENVGGLAESSPVEVNGYKVGIVESIRFLDPVSGKLLVVLSVNKDFKIPKNSKAEITTATLIAGMKIKLLYGNGPGFYSSGDTIPGVLAESIITVLMNEITPLKDRMVHLVSELDSVVESINEIMDPRFRHNIRNGAASLSNTAKSIEEADLKTTLENIRKFTEMLSVNSEKISGTFADLEQISDSLAASDIYKSIDNLKGSLEKSSVLLENLNNGKGTAGQLMTNDSLYKNLSNALGSLDVLLQDIKANPKRYVHFSIFGRKNTPAK